MSIEITPLRHAELGCEYLDEMIRELGSRRWCFVMTGVIIEDKVCEHAKALGLEPPFKRRDEEDESGKYCWLETCDPVTYGKHEFRILSLIARPGTNHLGKLHTLNQNEQVEFRRFVDKCKRKFYRCAKTRSETAQQWPAQASAVSTDSQTPNRQEESSPSVDYIDMDQSAALVNRSKKTLERALTDGKIPPPDIEGGGGKKHEWVYAKLKPWLEKEFGKNLPPRPPHVAR